MGNSFVKTPAFVCELRQPVWMFLWPISNLRLLICYLWLT